MAVLFVFVLEATVTVLIWDSSSKQTYSGMHFQMFSFMQGDIQTLHCTWTKTLQVNPRGGKYPPFSAWLLSCQGGKDFFLWFNSTIAFAIGVLGISRAFLVKLLRLCTIYHSLTCVMFQILVQRGYSWRQLSLCWAAIKDNISYLSKKGNLTRG